MQLDPPAPMTLLLQTAQTWVVHSLDARLATRGHPSLTEAQTALLSNLDCGTTYASAVAHRMGISRQAVYRTVREMAELGLLELQADPVKRNQKLIVMTDKANALVTDARAVLAEIEAELANRIGPADTAALRRALEAGWGDSLT
ncbi:hypothetical protein ACMU_16280 [Actibacterium mucosum KCTC 23349]|uniref:HTH marR-type domain-containing protein n=1 Tax=Actibacterium mucosum KCTC 23349 TaxID=1454373 RepID=A0A037ZEV5_9RHOB|nr:MarR family winged helix-turn-helix transcriptional regulator [Actibacterium mucosum]KAJ54672.1 hypothetical protein ACMU_16280 [Actibacterium mucosum KCTC 23349]